MKDIEIKISKETRQVDLSKYVIGNDAENLQGNLVFTFTDEFVIGQARLEYETSDTKAYLPLIQEEETYKMPIKSVITKQGQIYMQLVITEGIDEEEIPIFKSNVFYVVVNESINAEIEQPDEYQTWIEIANTKLNQIDNLNIKVEKVDNVSTLTITKKDGTTNSVEILDGEKGEKGDCNFATFDIIDGNLIMNKTEDMLLDFRLNENAELEVII